MSRRKIGWAIGLALTLGTLGCGMKPDDSEIARTVEQNLSADMTLSESRIDVASANGEVTLVGDVASAAERSRAEEIAERVEGVVSVRNQLSVTPAAAALPSVASPPPAASPAPSEAIGEVAPTDPETQKPADAPDVHQEGTPTPP